MASLVGKLGSPGRKKRGVSSAQRSVKRISKKYCIMKLEELVSVFGLPALPATKMDKHTRLKALVKTLLFDPRQKLLLNFAALPFETLLRISRRSENQRSEGYDALPCYCNK